MTSPVDPIRRVERVRRARNAPSAQADPASAGDFDERRLPTVVESNAEPPPAGGVRPAAAAYAAHVLGQDGQKRGLRGGKPVLDAARQTYTRTEWSGAADRRAKLGASTKTEI
jgi:hypothetical protein